MTIIFVKDPFSEEVSNMSEQGKSPETLENTKNGSTFAAKARAAELNANRAQKAVAKHAHIKNDEDEELNNDLPPLTPVQGGSSTITRYSLTEQPGVTANKRLKSPSPQHRSLPRLRISSVPRHTVSSEHFQYSTPYSVTHQAATFSEPEGDDRSVASVETAILWQPQDHTESSVTRSQPSSVPHKNLSTEYPNQSNSCPFTRPLASISGSKGEDSRVSLVTTAIHSAPPDQTQSSVRGLNQESSPAVSLKKQSPEKAPIDNLRHQQHHKSSQQAELSTPPNPGRNLAKASLTRKFPTIPLSHTHGTSGSERIRNCSSKSNTAPIPNPDQRQASPTFNKYRDYRLQESNHDQDDFLRTSADQNHAAMRPSSNTQSYGRGIPESLQNPRLNGLYQRALTNLPNARSVDLLRRPRDAKPYTNPYMPRTVAHDPVATVPTTVTARSVTSKSTLKPEAPVYTPKSAGDKGLGSTRPNTKAHVMAEGVGNGAMASFIKVRKPETAEDAVPWFHSKPMQKDVEAVLRQAEEHTRAMTAPLATNSFPDNGNSRSSLGPALPKPIGYGRPSPTRAPPTTSPTPHPLTKQFDSKAVGEMMASTIANLKQHEDPVPGDYSIRYRSAHACEVDQGPDGNKSLFDPAWGTPPPRVSRDPRRIGQGGSGGVSGTFGRH